MTGAYSIAGRDLRALLALLKPLPGGVTVPRHSGLLLRALAAMAAHSGPAAFFDFGDAGTGIVRTPPLRWALQRVEQIPGRSLAVSERSAQLFKKVVAAEAASRHARSQCSSQREALFWSSSSLMCS